MQLLADSGSTKTTWCLYDSTGQPVFTQRTAGLNPLLSSREEIHRIVSGVRSALPHLPTAIQFYGSGCGDHERQGQIGGVLEAVFPQTPTQVAGDLLGAARALCGHEAGIACILGTGMNSCHYDGHNISHQVPSLGFILGDEGSGTYLGKRILHDYFYGLTPTEISKSVAAQLPGDRSELLTRTYQSEAPAAFLAAFSHILSAHRKNTYSQQILAESFDAFCRLILAQYTTTLPVHFIGSIAQVFAPELGAALARHGRQLGSIVTDPIPGLLRYHAD